MKALKNLFFVLLILQSCSKSSNTPAVPAKSSAKAITAFTLAGLSATINEAAKMIAVTVPRTTNLTALVPAINVSDKAAVSPASGVVQDFSKDVSYTVMAEDGSTQVYKVTVTAAQVVTQVIDCKNVPAVLTDLGDGVDYSVGCPIQLSGSQELVINPGVRIQFNGAASGIFISGSAALKMVGTAAKPIILEGKTATPGSWTGVQIDSKNTDNQWAYVTLQHAGGGTNAAGLLISDDAYFLHNTQIAISHCTFANNNGYGIWDADNGFNYARTVFATFDSNTFTQNSNAPLCITIDGIGKFDTKSTYTGNGQNYIEVHGSDGLYANTLVQKLAVPYLIVGSIGLHQRMNISPGVTFQFYTDAGFNLDAQYMGSGTLIANGTAASPINFIGYKTGKGVWLGLSLGNDDPENLLNYCLIDGAGSNKPNNATACVGDVKGAVNFYPGCSAWANKPVATNCTISNCGGYGIIYKKGVVLSFTGNSYSGNSLTNEQGL